MQMGASGRDRPFIQGPAGWHRAVTPSSLFSAWACRWSRGRPSDACNEFQEAKRFQGKWRTYVAGPIWHSQCAWLAIRTLIKSGSVFEGAVRGAASWWQHGLCARAKSEVYLNMDLAVTVFSRAQLAERSLAHRWDRLRAAWHTGRRKFFQAAEWELRFSPSPLVVWAYS